MMQTIEIPTDEDIARSHDPAELRKWADWMEKYSAKIVEAIRVKADIVEIDNKLVAAIAEKAKLQRLSGAKETAFKKMQGG